MFRVKKNINNVNGGLSRFSHKKLRNFGYNLFSACGIPQEISKKVTDGLIDTSLRGVDSHGVSLIPHYIRAAETGRINKRAYFTFKKTGKSTGIVDADDGYGIAAGMFAMDKAVKLAKNTGICAVAVRNSSHFGAAAIYSIFAAERGMIGISCTHSDALVIPYAGKRPFLGTNPICFAAPCLDESPFCLDMATSQTTWNKVILYKNLRKKLDFGVAADNKGKVSIDPEKVVSLLPFSNYKGYGLSLMIEIFCSLLTEVDWGRNIKKMYPLDEGRRKLGHFFIAINIESFTTLRSFKKRLKKMLDELRSEPSFTKNRKIMVAGDPEKIKFKERLAKGIPLTSDTQEELRQMALKFRVNPDKYF